MGPTFTTPLLHAEYSVQLKWSVSIPYHNHVKDAVITWDVFFRYTGA